MLSSRSVSPSRRVRRTSRPPQLGHSGTLGMLRDCGEGPRSRNEPNALSFRGDLRIGRADADSENMTPEIARDLYGLTIPATSTVPRSVAGRSHRCQACEARWSIASCRLDSWSAGCFRCSDAARINVWIAAGASGTAHGSGAASRASERVPRLARFPSRAPRTAPRV